MRRLLGVLLVLAACGPRQTPKCAKYVACVAIVGSKIDGPDRDYGPDGYCWTNETLAEQCNTSCSAGLEEIRVTHPDAGC